MGHSLTHTRINTAVAPRTAKDPRVTPVTQAPARHTRRARAHPTPMNTAAAVLTPTVRDRPTRTLTVAALHTPNMGARATPTPTAAPLPARPVTAQLTPTPTVQRRRTIRRLVSTIRPPRTIRITRPLP